MGAEGVRRAVQRAQQPTPPASDAVPAISRSVPAWLVRPLELRWPLLDARDLGLDDVLAAPRLVEKLLVHRAGLLDGAVVVEHPLGVLDRQRGQAGDLGGPGLGVGQRPDAVGHPGLQGHVGRQLFGGQQHRAGPAVTDQ